MSERQAVVLLSGGLDSATCLAVARQQWRCYALSFAYGQRHGVEIEAARAIATHFGVEEHRIVDMDLGWIGGSALTDMRIAVPTSPGSGIPVTYVPARNTLFLSYALAWAEVLGVHDIFIGVNAVDYSGYPDCRPQFIEAFTRLANLATRAGVEGHSFTVHAPLQYLSKARIIEMGSRLGVPYALTVSCYQPSPDGTACGRCESCRLRKEGFAAARVADPTRYHDTGGRCEGA